MSGEELKERVRSWGRQIDVYNEGCQCEMCLINIREGFNNAIDEYIKHIKDEKIRSSFNKQQS